MQHALDVDAAPAEEFRNLEVYRDLNSGNNLRRLASSIT